MQLGLPFDDLSGTVAPPHPRTFVPTVAPSHPRTFGRTVAPPHLRTLAPEIAFYFVRHRLARRYVLRVDVDGRVRVTIPRGGSKREADAFAARHLDWIRGERSRLTCVARDPHALRVIRELSKTVLPARLRELAESHGLAVSRVSVRNQRSRWGSCGRDGHICLNWRLMLMPDWVRDYVLIHELMHLRRMDHSASYWRLVEEAYPNYDQARAWLRRNGPSLR